MRMRWVIAVVSLTTLASGQSRSVFRTRGGGLKALSVDRCDGASCTEWVGYPSRPPRAAVQTGMSRSSKHFFVWSRADGQARDLDIFESPTSVSRGHAHQTAHVQPGFGGELTWLEQDRLWHVWGCGTECVGAQLYDESGVLQFSGAGSLADASHDGKRVALVDAGHVWLVFAATLERFEASAPTGMPTGFAWRPNGFLVSFAGAKDRLECTPSSPGKLVCVPG